MSNVIKVHLLGVGELPEGWNQELGGEASVGIGKNAHDWSVPEKIVDPDALPTGDGYSCSFSPDNNYLAVGHDKSPSLIIYKSDQFSRMHPMTSCTDPGEIGMSLESKSAGEQIRVNLFPAINGGDA